MAVSIALLCMLRPDDDQDDMAESVAGRELSVGDAVEWKAATNMQCEEVGAGQGVCSAVWLSLYAVGREGGREQSAQRQSASARVWCREWQRQGCCCTAQAGV